ncbi:MAG TPA: glycosyltransferase family 2 protein [Gemmatimonadaceae bacterium]|nr:glycosyltransferase family 2 protein [Gemmatimonadaceae bacterium]
MKRGTPKRDVIVLLSAYNGARYIEQQIASIQQQSFRDWTLVIRDDGSTDGTADVVRRITAADPRVVLLPDSANNLGPWASFGALLMHAEERGADYVFVSDQDDVWVPQKMEMQLALLEAEAARSGSDYPVLVHSDMEIVDDELRTIHPSFSEHQRMSYYSADPLRTLLIHNAIAGCTMALNRPLLKAALPLPAGTYHDWWIALCAAGCGTISCAPKPLVRYRQHQANVVGADSRHSFFSSLVRHPLRFTRNAFAEFGVGVNQAVQLRNRLSTLAAQGAGSVERVNQYCDAFAPGSSLMSRLRAFRDSAARPQRAVSRAIMYAIIAAYPTFAPHDVVVPQRRDH